MNDRRRSSPGQGAIPGADDFQAIIVDGDPQPLVEWAEIVGQELANIRLTTSQIRNVFGSVRQIEMNWDQNPQEAYRQAILLKPKMAYFAKREKGMDHLERALSPALDLVAQVKSAEERKVRFVRFVQFFEAVLAYHKKHGGN
jgi:CRISPR-associated protein Csm2